MRHIDANLRYCRSIIRRVLPLTSIFTYLEGVGENVYFSAPVEFPLLLPEKRLVVHVCNFFKKQLVRVIAYIYCLAKCSFQNPSCYAS